MKKRHNIDTIAEVLIDKINDFEKSSAQIGKVVAELKATSLQVDTTEMKQILSERAKQENAFLSQYEAVQKINNTRLPNWILALLIGLFLALIGFSFFAWHQLKQIDLLKAEIEYYKSGQ